jgi:nitroreductase
MSEAFVPLLFDRLPLEESRARVTALRDLLRRRRSVRDFSPEPVPLALHAAGLATLTHTPSPMGLLTRVLGRSRNERPFVLIPVGYPAKDALVPSIAKKALEEIRTIV